MRINSTHRFIAAVLTPLFVALFTTGCRQNLLSTQDSDTQITFSALQSPATAQAAFYAAQASFINGVVGNTNYGTPDDNGNGLFLETGLMSDELGMQSNTNIHTFDIDARYTSYEDRDALGAQIGSSQVDQIIENLVEARSNLLLLVGPLAIYGQGDMARSLAGTAYVLAGYTELYMAEDYCPGVALDRALPVGGVLLATPLSADSVFGTAIGHFDSALASAYGNDTVIYLASIGKGRAWLGRDSLAEAAKAVAGVPLNFVYTLASAAANNRNSLLANFWDNTIYGYSLTGSRSRCFGNGWDVADRDGGVGMNFVSAIDGRLSLTDEGETCDGFYYGPQGTRSSRYNGLTDSIFYYPTKFGPAGNSTGIPIATGVEAALITAEAAGMNGNDGAMLSQLQTLRQNAGQTYLQVNTPMPMLTADSLAATGAAAISILFRERAFWLYGTGTRLGDMRREVRQYGKVLVVGNPQAAINLVYPNGPYTPLGQDFSAASPQIYGSPAFFSTYGADVVLELPASYSNGSPISINPRYKGCTEPTTSP